jgi:hypothetical protein
MTEPRYEVKIGDDAAMHTNMRGLTEEEFLRGKEQLRRAVHTAPTETRTNWLDLLVLR